MPILPGGSLDCFSIFQRSMIQGKELPLSEVLDSSLFAEAFKEDDVVFGIADENVFTPAITLWAMISQFLFKQEGRLCKAAAGRVVSLIAQISGRVVAHVAFVGTHKYVLTFVTGSPKGQWDDVSCGPLSPRID